MNIVLIPGMTQVSNVWGSVTSEEALVAVLPAQLHKADPEPELKSKPDPAAETGPMPHAPEFLTQPRWVCLNEDARAEQG